MCFWSNDNNISTDTLPWKLGDIIEGFEFTFKHKSWRIYFARTTFQHKMQASHPFKKVRTDNVSDQVVELDAKSVIAFFFGSSTEPIHPEYVHQNFGHKGKITWLKQFMPLSIAVRVDTKNGMKVNNVDQLSILMKF